MDSQELKEKFGTPEQCLDYITKLRFPYGVCCENRKCEKYINPNLKKEYKLTDYKFKCFYCKSQISATSYSIFEGTPRRLLPLWFKAIWYVTSERSGTSALELQKVLELGTYRTAWTWLQELRSVMMKNQEKLQGTVIIDKFEIIVNKDSYSENEYTVLIALEFNKKKFGQIRMIEIKYDDSDKIDEADKIADFIKYNVKPLESTLFSYKGYSAIDFSKLSETDYPLKLVKKKGKNFEPICKVISYLEKKELLNTLACAGSRKNLSSYLKECCFKFNKRKNKDNWFYDLLDNTVYPPRSPKEAAIQKEMEEAEEAEYPSV